MNRPVMLVLLLCVAGLPACHAVPPEPPRVGSPPRIAAAAQAPDVQRSTDDAEVREWVREYALRLEAARQSYLAAWRLCHAEPVQDLQDQRRCATVRRQLWGLWFTDVLDKIRHSWPQAARHIADGHRCEAHIMLQPDGRVSDVRIGRCSFDGSERVALRTAVLNASPLPLPADPSLLSPRLTVTVGSSFPASDSQLESAYAALYVNARKRWLAEHPEDVRNVAQLRLCLLGRAQDTALCDRVMTHIGQRWHAWLTELVRRGWTPPAGDPADGRSCLLEVMLNPDGRVSDVRFFRCDLDAAQRAAATAAVRRASPLPLPPDPILFTPEVAIFLNPSPQVAMRRPIAHVAARRPMPPEYQWNDAGLAAYFAARKQWSAEHPVEAALLQRCFDAPTDVVADCAAVRERVNVEWRRQVTEKIRRLWVRPPDLHEGTCVVQFVEGLGGRVADVSLGSCSFGESVRSSLERAVHLASPLPPTPDLSLFNPRMSIIFKP